MTSSGVDGGRAPGYLLLHLLRNEAVAFVSKPEMECNGTVSGQPAEELPLLSPHSPPLP
jgi:hypothetical protein